MTLSRRSFLTGLIAAPVIIKAASLMPVRSIVMPPEPIWIIEWNPTTPYMDYLWYDEAIAEIKKIMLIPSQYLQTGEIPTCQSFALTRWPTVLPKPSSTPTTKPDTDPT